MLIASSSAYFLPGPPWEEMNQFLPKHKAFPAHLCYNPEHATSTISCYGNANLWAATQSSLLNMMNQATPTDKKSHVLDITIWAIWCGLGSSAPLLYRGQALNISQSVLLEPGDCRSFCEVGVLKNIAGAGVVSRWL